MADPVHLFPSSDGPTTPALPQNVEAEAALLGALMIDNRLAIDLHDELGSPLETIRLGLARFRRPIRDYFAICDSYFKAIRSATPAGIETIDMARRALHNDAAELLKDCLGDRIEMDFDTARRLFTLICVLVYK
jgi:uncharacterized protein (UPF0262 family)